MAYLGVEVSNWNEHNLTTFHISSWKCNSYPVWTKQKEQTKKKQQRPKQGNRQKDTQKWKEKQKERNNKERNNKKQNTKNGINYQKESCFLAIFQCYLKQLFYLLEYE